MYEEMDSLIQNQTWDLVKLPASKKVLYNKYVYRIKDEVGGKESLVIKGYA